MSAKDAGQQTTLAEACQRARADAEAGVSASEADADPEAADLDCGHASVYAQGGECLICDQRWNTDTERAVERGAATDGLEGRL